MKKRLLDTGLFLLAIAAIIFVPWCAGYAATPPEKWEEESKALFRWMNGVAAIVGVGFIIGVLVFWVRWVFTGNRPFES